MVIGLLGLTSLAARPIRENYFEISKQLEILNALFRELNIYYVDELQPGEIMETGIKAMVHSLDPYTVYYPESRVEDLRFMTTGEYGGVGATVQQMGGKTTLVDVFLSKEQDELRQCYETYFHLGCVDYEPYDEDAPDTYFGFCDPREGSSRARRIGEMYTLAHLECCECSRQRVML